MFSIQKNTKVVFYSKPVSLLKSFNGLSAIVANEIRMELDSNTYFLFTNFKKNMLKILYLDGTNLAIWFKKLDGTLSFKFSDQIILFDEKEFSDFICKITSRRSYEFEKKQRN